MGYLLMGGIKDTPFFKRQAKKKTQSKGYWRSPKQEKELAKRIGGRKIPGSGSGKTKGDVRRQSIIRIEAKCTEKKSISITRDMIEKIELAAIGNNEIPVIHIEFIDASGKPEMEIAVIPTWILENLCDSI